MLAALWNLGIWEILLVLMIFILLFGARRIPEIARSLGRARKEFRKGVKEAEEFGREIEDADGEKDGPAGRATGEKPRAGTRAE